MAYEQYIWEERRQFSVVCKDMNMKQGELTEGSTYRVLGMIQSMYIMRNDRGVVTLYHMSRFHSVSESLRSLANL